MYEGEESCEEAAYTEDAAVAEETAEQEMTEVPENPGYDSQAAEQAAADQLELDSVNQEQAEVFAEEQTDGADAEASVSADDLTLLAAIIHCEAGGECRDGKVAVGAVIMNRLASDQFPNTISGVVYQAGQFTPASSGALANAIANGVDEDCYEAARAALGGENPIGGLLYFHAGGGSGLTIGNQTFY
jgi:spore germination cell wall hydrolase CwlJ-like protein